MIKNGGLYYLYRHIRLDTNQVFYVGIGSKTKDDLKYGRYARAHQKHNRSGFWKIVTKKSKYVIEILLETDSMRFLKDKEREFIKLYGRKDLGTGSLVNLTDGGEGLMNLGKNTNIKRIQTLKRNGNYESMIKRMIDNCKKNSQNGNTSNKKVYIYSLDGLFANECNKVIDCAKLLNTSKVTLLKSIKNRLSVNGFYVTFEKLDIVNTSLYKEKMYKKEVLKIDSKGLKILESFESIQSAANSVSADKGNLFSSIKRIIKCKGYYWCYSNKYDIFLQKYNDKSNKEYPEYLREKARNTFMEHRLKNPQSHIVEKKVINIITKEVFDGISKIKDIVNKPTRLIQRRLSGEIHNDTDFMYLCNYSKINNN